MVPDPQGKDRMTVITIALSDETALALKVPEDALADELRIEVVRKP